MSSQVTMQDVARAAGVHQTTVSLALRDHPRISAGTIRRVKAAAARLGYQPNPLVSALIAGRKRRTPVAHATIGYVHLDPRPEVWVYQHLDQGLEARAAELGYRIDRFWLGDEHIPRKRLAQIFATRAIHGIILAPVNISQKAPDLPWESLAAVTYGYSIAEPPLHRVTPDFYHSMIALCGRCRTAGWRQVGLILDRNADLKADHLWLAAFLAEQRLQAALGRIPPLLVAGWSEADFSRWYGRYRPETLVSLTTALQKAEDWLRDHAVGAPAPRYLALDAEPEGDARGYAGMAVDRVACGRTCVDVLVEQLHRNQKGIPRQAHHVFIDTVWHPGTR
ncbi:MAG: LacI family transcriptional regulator [Candidatus Marinimicrobia bacterium]|nr:LacI family transcriptional regulator [Candidatus Neomarinimicrobiota bacterium]